MKKILKLSVLPLLFLSIMSCSSDDDNTVANPSMAPELISPEDGTAIVLDPLYNTNPAITLVWNHAGYDVPTEVTYNVEVAVAGTDFAEVALAGAPTSNKVLTLNVEELNMAAIAAGLTAFEPGELDMRVVATLGDNAEMRMESNIITITVTPYTTDIPTLAVIGNHNGWTFDNVPLLAASAFGETDYEGYVWLDGGFKFVLPNNQGEFAWPDAGGGPNYGGADGTLVENGPDITAPAGYYLVKVDTEAGTYSLTQTDWGIVGNATPGGWDNSTPMTYDQETRTWSLVTELTTQAAPDNGWKFRANNEWTLNLGDPVLNSTDGTLVYNGTNISATAGTYLITLDLSHPRAYTYTVTPQ